MKTPVKIPECFLRQGMTVIRLTLEGQGLFASDNGKITGILIDVCKIKGKDGDQM